MSFDPSFDSVWSVLESVVALSDAAKVGAVDGSIAGTGADVTGASEDGRIQSEVIQRRETNGMQKRS